MSSRQRNLDIVWLALFLLAVWQGLSMLAGSDTLISPIGTMRHLAELLQTERFNADMLETLRAIAAAVPGAILLGVSCGVLLGLHHRSGDVTEPMLVTLYALPKVIFYPIVLLICGLGISARITFGIIHGVFPIILFVMNAIRNIRPVTLRSARAFHLSNAQTISTIVLPAALPGIMTGVRVGTSVTLLGVLIGEMFAAKHGLGFRLMTAIDSHDQASIVAIAVLFSAFALIINAALLALSRRINRDT